MKALILAAGYATRLYPLTREYPKALLEVGKKPIINYLVEKLNKIGQIDEIMVVTNSKFITRFRDWQRKIKTKKRLSLIDDATYHYCQRRGAVGDMRFAIKKKKIQKDLLVIGADNLFDGGLKDFLDFAQSKDPYVVTGAYDLKDRRQARKYGVIKLDAKNKIIAFQEKPASPKSSLVAMCLYYFPKAKLNRIAEFLAKRREKKDAIGFYIEWLHKKEPVYSFIFKRRWYDIGDRYFYQQAQEQFAKIKEGL